MDDLYPPSISGDSEDSRLRGSSPPRNRFLEGIVHRPHRQHVPLPLLMLERFLEEDPTVTERLLFCQSPKYRKRQERYIEKAPRADSIDVGVSLAVEDYVLPADRLVRELERIFKRCKSIDCGRESMGPGKDSRVVGFFPPSVSPSVSASQRQIDDLSSIFKDLSYEDDNISGESSSHVNHPPLLIHAPNSSPPALGRVSGAVDTAAQPDYTRTAQGSSNKRSKRTLGQDVSQRQGLSNVESQSVNSDLVKPSPLSHPTGRSTSADFIDDDERKGKPTVHKAVKSWLCNICFDGGKTKFFGCLRDLVEHLKGPHKMVGGHLMLADYQGHADWRGLCTRCLIIFETAKSAHAPDALQRHSKNHKEKGDNEHRSETWSRRKYDAIKYIFASRLDVTEILQDYNFIRLASDDEYAVKESQSLQQTSQEACVLLESQNAREPLPQPKLAQQSSNGVRKALNHRSAEKSLLKRKAADSTIEEYRRSHVESNENLIFLQPDILHQPVPVSPQTIIQDCPADDGSYNIEEFIHTDMCLPFKESFAPSSSENESVSQSSVNGNTGSFFSGQNEELTNPTDVSEIDCSIG